jgi:hypothetical protein
VTRSGRRVHFAFILAAVVVCFAVYVPASWPRHVAALAVAATLLAAGVLGGMAAAAWDIVRGSRRDRWGRW